MFKGGVLLFLPDIFLIIFHTVLVFVDWLWLVGIVSGVSILSEGGGGLSVIFL